MPDIRPVTDLRNHFKEVEKTLQKTGGPIFFTQNGRASCVLLSNEKYDRLLGDPVAPAVELSAEEKERFGSIIKDLRTAKELSQTCLAEKVGCAAENIADIEAGKIAPKAEDVPALADALGVSPSTLVVFLEHDAEPSWVKRGLADLLKKIVE